jgi:hypothetical protein
MLPYFNLSARASFDFLLDSSFFGGVFFLVFLSCLFLGGVPSYLTSVLCFAAPLFRQSHDGAGGCIFMINR